MSMKSPVSNICLVACAKRLSSRFVGGSERMPCRKQASAKTIRMKIARLRDEAAKSTADVSRRERSRRGRDSCIGFFENERSGRDHIEQAAPDKSAANGRENPRRRRQFHLPRSVARPSRAAWAETCQERTKNAPLSEDLPSPAFAPKHWEQALERPAENRHSAPAEQALRGNIVRCRGSGVLDSLAAIAAIHGSNRASGEHSGAKNEANGSHRRRR